MKVKGIFPVSVVETNDTLKEVSRDRGTLYFRLAIKPSGDEATLSEEDKKLLAQLSATAKDITLKGQLNREISNVFPASILSDYIEGIDDIKSEDLTDETQDDLVSQISEILKAEKGYIFTYYTFSVSDLLAGSEYETDKVFTENGSIVRQRNNLYFGFFNDEEEAFGFMRSRLIQEIEDEKLFVENPSIEEKPAEKPAEKPRIQLRRK